MEATRKQLLRKVVLITDAVAIFVSMFAAFTSHSLLRDLLPFLKEPPQFRHYAILAYLALPAWLLLVVLFRQHRCFENRWTAAQLFFDLLKVNLVGLLALSMLLFLTQSIVNRTLVALFMGFTLLLMWLARIGIGRRLRQRAGSGFGRLQALLVCGSPSELSEFVHAARLEPLPPDFVGYLSDAERAGEEAAEPPADFPPRLGGLADLETVLHDRAVDQVLFFPPHDRPERADQELDMLRLLGVPASFAIQRISWFDTPPRVLSFYGEDFVTFEESRRDSEALAVKHSLDVLAAAAGLLVLAPLLLLVSLAILVTMGRPVFFAQERAGLFGRRFRMLKFRTMVRGAEKQRDELLELNEMSGPVFKITDDPRITRLGKLLRSSSLDELPQLFNVLTGSMSLVGPRPLPFHEQQQIHGWHRRRISMKPGITGLWQVSGRSEVDFEDWIQLDLRYIDEWTPWLDIHLLLRTIPAVLFGRGSR
jgi:exopolysaccharide biosynthesis polyprenyl glycosylphosphotransferase